MLVLLEATYPYQMSYLNHWREAWREAFPLEIKQINIAQTREHTRLKAILKSADIIVMLHSCTADSNLWIESIKESLNARRCPLIVFIGNEYNSPTLSVERRLRNLGDVAPEIIASQLNQDSAEWLYSGLGNKIVSAPHGMCKPNETVKKEIDFAYYGFKYPSYVFGSQRNEIVQAIVDSFERRRLKVQYSYEKRLSADKWIALMNKSRVTASTEAGASHIFKTDKIWGWMHEKSKLISSDNVVLHQARRLPTFVKGPLRKLALTAGWNYGSLEKKSQSDAAFLDQLISEFESRDGRCISSRHLEAVSAGCWQLLYKGEYSGILKSGLHFTQLDSFDLKTLEEAIDASLDIANTPYPREIREDLYRSHSYKVRISSLLNNLP